ncbi:MAG: hypothetical protein AB1324_05330 [Candidatus Micrarchaeota archaeon]
MDAQGAALLVWTRFGELALAPLRNQEMLWAALPLAIATVFITLYFARNKGEELGWNTAFGNTMAFIFAAINLIREMSRQEGSIGSIASNPLYAGLSVLLAGTGATLMLITYFHLMPRRAAFFLFSAIPINVSVYVAMSIVYGGVPPDIVTAAAGALLLLAILVAAKLVQAPISALIGYDERHDEVEELAEEVEEEIERRRRRNAVRPRS